MTSSGCTQLPPWSTRSHRAQTCTGDPGGGSRADSGRGECASAAEVAASGTVSRLRTLSSVTRAAVVNGGSGGDLVDVEVTFEAPSRGAGTPSRGHFRAPGPRVDD